MSKPDVTVILESYNHAEPGAMRCRCDADAHAQELLRRGTPVHRALGLAKWQAVVSLPLFSLLRLIDLAGIVRAWAPGGKTSGVGLKAVET